MASDISEQVRLLERLVRYRFGDDAQRMTAWASAHNVAGLFWRSATEEEGRAPGSEKAA